MEGATNTTTNESEASKASNEPAAAGATATTDESYVTKASKYFFGYIFGASGEEQPAPAVETPCDAEEEESEEESDEDEDEEDEVEQPVPVEVRSELVSLEDYCSDSSEDDEDVSSSSKKEVDTSSKSRALQKTADSNGPAKSVCINFVRGTCKNGDKCEDSHPPELAPASAEKKVCPFFLQNTCR